MHIQGKVALITGGVQGLGKAFCEALLKRGAKVCLADVNTNQGAATLLEFQRTYGKDRAIFVKCDVTSKTDLENALQLTKSTFGSLDILGNNAGIMDETNWQRTVDINLSAVIQGSLLGIEYMRKDKGGNGGVIINTASMAGIVANPFFPVYTATKHGVVGFTRSWGAVCILQPETGVRVNCICPEFVNTPAFDNFRPDQSVMPDKLLQAVEHIGLMMPSFVAEGFIQLIEDDSKNGEVMKITSRKGIEFQRYPDKPAKL